MKLEEFAAYQPELIKEKNCHRASVAVLLQGPAGEERVLFEQRSSRIADQPGDICLPGGMAEPGESPWETARRECAEELLLEESQLELIGSLDYLYTGNLLLTPFLARLADYRGSFSRDEVAEVFTVPLAFFRDTEPERYSMEWKPQMPEDFPFERIRGGRDYRWRRSTREVVFYEYGGRTIWGLTAKLMQSLGEKLRG